jgi:hypothetical protein
MDSSDKMMLITILTIVAVLTAGCALGAYDALLQRDCRMKLAAIPDTHYSVADLNVLCK